MATITVRIEDSVRNALQAKADEERQTLSDFVRDCLQDAVFSFRDADKATGSRSEGFEPETLSPLDRHKLALLHRILARVLPEDANDVDGDSAHQLERANVLERGFTREYSMEFAGLRSELNSKHCDFVMDVLELSRIALYSINYLREEGVDVDDSLERSLKYSGFDHNDSLELQMSSYVRFLVSEEKWVEQKDFVLGRARGNSHSQMIPVYSRMLTEYREIKQNRARRVGMMDYHLTVEELQRIAAAQIHPSNR